MTLFSRNNIEGFAQNNWHKILGGNTGYNITEFMTKLAIYY